MDDAAHEGWPIKVVWEKYEDIAMHFNDLLIRLRTQALAGVAAITALVGLFAKGGGLKFSWELAIAGLFLLCVFWIAIWVIDFRYYNRLLIGAVAAIIEVENLSVERTHIPELKMSQRIEDAVAGRLPIRYMTGPTIFYGLVLFALVIGLIFSICQFVATRP